jgi:lipopolysaccharide biosynthesis glycosyltransferase
MATDNISIRIIDISSLLKNRHFHIVLKRFSVETYARFFIPDIFEKYDRILWLDSDTIVLKDIAELINIDMGDKWWAATKDLGPLNPGCRMHFCNIMYPYKVTDYFQAGIVVWNIPECRKSNMTTLLLDALRDMGPTSLQDQDVMNSVAKGQDRVLPLNQLWNVADVMDIVSPYIIHFNRKVKPWNARYREEYDDYFWLYAKKTRFYKIIKFRQIIDFFTRNIRKILHPEKSGGF